MKKILLLVYLLSYDVAASTLREDLAQLSETVVQMKHQADEVRKQSYAQTLVKKIWPSAVEARDRLKVFHTAAEKVRLIAYKNMRFEGMMNRRPGSLYGLSELAEEKYSGLTSTVMWALSVATRASNKATNLSGELDRAKAAKDWALRILQTTDHVRAKIYLKNVIYNLSFYKKDVDKSIKDAATLRTWAVRELSRISDLVEYLSSDNIEKRHILAYKVADDYLADQTEVIMEIYEEIDRQYKIREKKILSEVNFSMDQARILQLNVNMMEKFSTGLEI
ncbi:hypothetical protein BAZMOX_25418_1 [methanotrophic endosymbiont of Bathymodiolus azoricus (Menez Gwen)]|nr:hypothetical protein BAZMOX_25418_1 [methanotrophic endosymbiont of Bathymodiolus azoricus (Menez Gwen)]